MGFVLCGGSKVLRRLAEIYTGWKNLKAPALLVGCILLHSGCASPQKHTSNGDRPFRFEADTLAYPNELVWIYNFDSAGKWTHSRREPPPTYSHHCFVVARSAKQFFAHAKFDPSLPTASEETYRQLVAKVVSISPSRLLPERQRIVIPGYSNLYTFSKAWPAVLKEECGGAWRSYVQRGHWRMIWPFSRHEQEKMAAQLSEDINENRPPVVHVVRFPQLKINHAVVLFGVKEDANEIRFATYDPNVPEKPTELTYNRATKTFSLPQNEYFEGGRVDVYEIYHRWNY
jgi:hypothetical protein